jgi:hypothetical protein
MNNSERRLVTVNATDQELSSLIQRLTARIEALEAALRRIADPDDYTQGYGQAHCQEIARAALDKDAGTG